MWYDIIKLDIPFSNGKLLKNHGQNRYCSTCIALVYFTKFFLSNIELYDGPPTVYHSVTDGSVLCKSNSWDTFSLFLHWTRCGGYHMRIEEPVMRSFDFLSCVSPNNPNHKKPSLMINDTPYCSCDVTLTTRSRLTTILWPCAYEFWYFYLQIGFLIYSQLVFLRLIEAAA